MKTTLLIVLTAVLLFLIGFISDLVVQFIAPRVSSQSRIKLYRPFWDHYGVFGAATVAGLITFIFGGLFLTLSIMIFNCLQLDMSSWTFVLFSTALAFVLGVILDVWTNDGNWLGKPFRMWYDGAGRTTAALWSGGLTFAFVAFIASMFIKFNV